MFMALTSPTSGGRSVGLARLRTKATELVLSAMDGKTEQHIFMKP
jgi:hypothetical protein